MGDRDSAARTLDLRSLELRPGEARTVDVSVGFDGVVIADQPYATDPSEQPAVLEVSQSASGWHFRLRAEVAVTGPCMRCLGDAKVQLNADVRDFAAFGRESAREYDEDLDCEYLDAERLDIDAMARDAFVDVLPTIILCQDDCAGLCPSCGADLNATTCECAVDEVDPRWAGLEHLARQWNADE